MAGSVAMKDVVDAWIAELTENVDGLQSAARHAAAPWNPELMAVMQGERHVAVYPGPSAMVAVDAYTDAHELSMTFFVSIWEAAGDAQSRLAADYAKDFEFMEVCEAARDRFYVTANRTKAGTQNTEFKNMDLTDGSGSVRSALIEFEVRTIAAFI